MLSSEKVVIIFGTFLIVLSLYFLFWSENKILSFVSVLLLIISFPASYIIFNKKKSKKRTIKSTLKGSFNLGSNKQLDKMTHMTNERLYELSSVFPFDLFPNKIIIGQKQVILIYKQFFLTSQVYNFLIQDILTPVVGSSVFFSTLRIELGPGGFQQNPPSIRYLKKNEALKARRIIMGLIICMKEKIDLSKMDSEEIVKKVEEIGRFKSG